MLLQTSLEKPVSKNITYLSTESTNPPLETPVSQVTVLKVSSAWPLASRAVKARRHKVSASTHFPWSFQRGRIEFFHQEKV